MMANVDTCKGCQAPALSGMYYCASCLLLPLSGVNAEASSASEDTTLAFQPKAKIGRFEVLESLGVGGFSEVYSVIDRESTNSVPLAIKVMRMGLNSAEFLTRFEQEHLILRRLEDPSIVRVFETGITEGGRPYFAMEQIDGLRITDFCDSERLSLESRIELFIDVCRAVHHAHQKGIIHRDLKPANILVAQREGLLVPVVIDFGLAKAIETWNEASESMPASAWVTQLGIAMGTPGYLSPEQADGTEDTDTLSDVFSLGVVLYELIAHCPPWPHDTWKRVPHSKWSQYKRENAPPKPSSHGPNSGLGRRIDDDLDTICMKALAVDRDQRYESVAQLATDLMHWLRGDPILARPPSLTYRLGKLVSRYRWQSATLVASLLACIVVAVLGVTLAIRERRYSAKWAMERNAAVKAKKQANDLRELAIEERIIAQRSAYASSIGLAAVHMANAQPYLGQQILNATQSSLRSWEWKYLQAQVPRPVVSIATGVEVPVSLGVSKNREFAVVSDGRRLVRLELKTGKCSQPTVVESKVQHISISDDGVYVAALTHQATSSIKVYRFQPGLAPSGSDRFAEVWSYPVHGDSSLAWDSSSGSSRLIVVEGNGSEPSVWNLWALNGHNGEVQNKTALKRWKLADQGLVLGESHAIVRCSFDRLAVVQLSDLSLLGYVIGFPNSLIADFQLNVDENRVVFLQGGYVFETKWGQLEKEVAELSPNLFPRKVMQSDKQSGELQRLNRNATGQWMAISDSHCLVEGEKPVLLPTKSETQQISLLDGSYATILPNGDMEIRQELQELDGKRFSSRTVQPNPEGRRVVISPSSEYCLYQTWSRQNLFRSSLLEVGDPEVIEMPANPQLEWSRLPIFHPDGTAVIATLPQESHGEKGSELATLRLVEGAENIEPLPIDATPWSAAVSPDGERLFVGTLEGVKEVEWTRRELKHDWKLPNGPFVVMSMADSSGVFAIGVDHVVHCLRLDGKPVPSERMMEQAVGAVPATSDYLVDEQIFAISESSGVGLYELGSAKRKLGELPAEARVTAIRFSQDGKRIAIAMANRKIALWDWRGKHRLMDLSTRGVCSSLDFSRDGEWLVNTDFAPCLTIR